MEGNSGLFAESPMLGCVPILAQGVVVESELINKNPSAPEPPSKLRMEQMLCDSRWCTLVPQPPLAKLWPPNPNQTNKNMESHFEVPLS